MNWVLPVLFCSVLFCSVRFLFCSVWLFSQLAMRTEALKVPLGEEEAIEKANREVTRLKHQVTFLVKDGVSFPALQEIQRQKSQLMQNQQICHEMSRQVTSSYGL